MSDKIECGGLITRSDLCLIEVLGFAWLPGQTCCLLGKFGEAEISLQYLSIVRDTQNRRTMSFCVSTDQMATHRGLLDEIEQEFKPEKVQANAPVVVLTLYGPHFLERHTLASEVFSALCMDSINTHTVCSSVNSISVVVDKHDEARTVACLRQRFYWPE